MGTHGCLERLLLFGNPGSIWTTLPYTHIFTVFLGNILPEFHFVSRTGKNSFVPFANERFPFSQCEKMCQV